MALFKKKNPVREKLKDKFLSEQELLDLLPNLSSSELYLITKHVWLTPKVLTEAAKLADERDLYSLLSHPKFPIRELRKYVESSLAEKKLKKNSNYVLYSRDNYEAIVLNINCPSELLEMLYGVTYDAVDKRIAAHPNLSKKLFKQIINSDDIEILKILCTNPSLTNSQLKSLINLSYTILDKYISQNPNLDDNNLDAISRRSTENSNSSSQKIKKVKNIKLSNIVLLNDLNELHRLSRDEDVMVRLEVAKNSLLPSNSLKNMIEFETELEVLLTLFENQYLDFTNRTAIEERLNYFDWPYKKLDPRLETRYRAAMDCLTDNY